MTTLTIQLPEDKVVIARKQAGRYGITVDDYFASLIGLSEQKYDIGTLRVKENAENWWEDWWANLNFSPQEYTDFMDDYLKNERKTIQFQERESFE